LAYDSFAKFDIVWKQLFPAIWKTHKATFGDIITTIGRLRDLIANHASVMQIKAFQDACQNQDKQSEEMLQNETLRRRQAVSKWLVGTRNGEHQHEQFLEKRVNFPNSSGWLLKQKAFKDWFDPKYPAIPPLLWLTGDPGSGEYSFHFVHHGTTSGRIRITCKYSDQRSSLSKFW
jgi:hypothetical protein